MAVTAPPAIGVLIGTRPEAIKLMPVIRALEALALSPAVFFTGQHTDLLDATLADLGLEPTESLEVLQHEQSLAELSARILTGVRGLLQRRRPRLLLVQGDTSSVALGALAAFYEGIAVAHVEAGLRSGDARNPFPEEMHRRLTACVADLHFAPTPGAGAHLLREGVAADRIHVVGNTVIDALFHARDRLAARPLHPELASALAAGRHVVLVTAHRRESFGPDLAALCRGLRRLADRLPDTCRILFPVHVNPNVHGVVHELLGGLDPLRLLPPLAYLDFVQILLRARLVITDSGGVQEEATALGIPLLVVRRTTERPEAIESGVGELIEPDAERLFEAAFRLLTDAAAHRRRATPSGVFGDGHAGERIADILRRSLAGY